MVDTSGSIQNRNPSNWGLVKEFITNVTRRYNVGEDGARVGIVEFSKEANVAFYLDEYYTQSDLEVAIGNLNYQGKSTNIAEGFETARKKLLQESRGDRKDVKNFCILITDGNPNVRRTDTLSEAEKLKEVSTVISVGVTKGIGRQLLEEMSSDGRVVDVDDFDTLEEEVNGLVILVCPAEDPGI